MHFLRTYFLYPLLMAALFTALAGCGRRSPGTEASLQAAAAAQFRQSLDSLSALKNDTLKSPAIRRLYAAADTSLHEAVLERVLEGVKPVLYSNASVDPGILPFYRSLTTERSLSPKSRTRAMLQLATFYASIARQADSAGFYLERSGREPGIMSDSLRAVWTGVSAQRYLLQSKLPEAAAEFYRAIALFEKTHDSGRAALTYGNLANVFRGMGDHRKAASLRRMPYTYYSRTGDSMQQLTALQGLAADYKELQQYDSARICFNTAEALLDAGVRNPTVAFYLYFSKAGMYTALNDYDSARRYFDKAKPLLATLQDPGLEFYFTVASLPAYAAIHDVRREKAVMEEALPGLLASGDLEAAKSIYQSLYTVAAQTKDYKEALDAYLHYDSVRSTLSDSAARNYAAGLEARYESQRKNLTIGMQRRALAQQRTANWLLVLALIVAALSGAVLFARLKLQRARKEAILQKQFTRALLRNTETERSRIAGHLHDGLGHELLHLKHQLSGSTPLLEETIDGLINEVRSISRALHPVMLDKIGLRHSIEHLCEQTMAGGKLFLSSEIDYDRNLPPDAELQLYRIIQESLTNILRHAGAMAAKITIRSSESQLAADIIDNGHGFDPEAALAAGGAFGLLSIIERSRALSGNAVIESSPAGTRIHITIPLTHGPYSHR